MELLRCDLTLVNLAGRERHEQNVVLDAVASGQGRNGPCSNNAGAHTLLVARLKEEQANTAPPTLADVIQGILSRRAQAGKSVYSQSLYNLKDAANMLNFLQQNQIRDMAGLDEKFKAMIGEQTDIREKLKPIERRMDTLKKHIGQADTYLKYKGKKPLTESEQILFTAAKDYLKGVMNGKTALPTKAWKLEYSKLFAERKTLNQQHLALKAEVKGSRADPQERLQYLAAGTAGASTPQGAGHGVVKRQIGE